MRPIIHIRCDGGKTPRKADIRPFNVACPAEGFTPGFSAVAVAWAKRYKGRPYLFRAFARHRKRDREQLGATASVANGWQVEEASADSDMHRDMYYEIHERCGMDRQACAAAGNTPYGPRHIMPDLTRTAGWPLEDRMELGRWSLAIIRAYVEAAHSAGVSTRRTQQAGDLRRAMANLYSRGNAAVQREVALRRRAIAIVRDFIGDRDWWTVIKVQAGPPDFDYIVASPVRPREADADEGEDEVEE